MFLIGDKLFHWAAKDNLHVTEDQGGERPLQPRRLGQIDFESVAFPLVSAGHLGAGVSKVLLHMCLLDLRGGGEAGAQRVPGEGAFAFTLG